MMVLIASHCTAVLQLYYAIHSCDIRFGLYYTNDGTTVHETKTLIGMRIISDTKSVCFVFEVAENKISMSHLVTTVVSRTSFTDLFRNPHLTIHIKNINRE